MRTSFRARKYCSPGSIFPYRSHGRVPGRYAVKGFVIVRPGPRHYQLGESPNPESTMARLFWLTLIAAFAAALLAGASWAAALFAVGTVLGSPPPRWARNRLYCCGR